MPEPSEWPLKSAEACSRSWRRGVISPSPSRPLAASKRRRQVQPAAPNCAIFHTTIDMMTVIRDLQAEGRSVTADGLAVISPYITESIKRFGDYPTDELAILPAAFDPRLDLDGDVDAAA